MVQATYAQTHVAVLDGVDPDDSEDDPVAVNDGVVDGEGVFVAEMDPVPDELAVALGDCVIVLVGVMVGVGGFTTTGIR